MIKNALQSLEYGFQLFDWYHISWLLFTLLIIFILYKFYSKNNELHRRKMRIVWACLILLLEIIKNIVLLVQDSFWYGSWPLHLCGLGIFIILAHAFVKGHQIDMLLYCLTMPGALMALITPEWTHVSAFDYLHFHSFLFHCFLFAYPVVMLLTKELQLSIKKIWQPIAFLVVVVPPIYALNVAWGTNFMFTRKAPAGTPLILLEQHLPQYLYIVGFSGLVIVCWILLLLPIVVWKRIATK